MSTTNTLAIRALIFSAALCTPNAMGQQLLDDFSGGTDASWTHDDQLAANSLGTTTYSVDFGRYFIGSAAPFTASNQVHSGAYLTASATDATYSSGILDLDVSAPIASGRSVIFVRSSAGFQDGYAFSLAYQPTNSISIARVTGGVATTLTSAPMTLTGETIYRVVVEFRGNLLTMKAWDKFSGTDPIEPLIFALDSSHTHGRIAIGLGNEPSSSTNVSAGFDNVLFTPCGGITQYGAGCLGSNGLVPSLSVAGCVTKGGSIGVSMKNGLPGSAAILIVGTQQASVAAGAGCSLLVGSVGPLATIGPFALDATFGDADFQATIPLNAPSISVTMQAWMADASATIGASTSNGVEIVIP